MSLKANLTPFTQVLVKYLNRLRSCGDCYGESMIRMYRDNVYK